MNKLGRFFERRSPRRAPKAPDGHLIYAVGDVHGCDDLLAGLLDLIREDAASSQEEYDNLDVHVVFLGDYIDRGPNSRRVIDILTHAPFPQARTHFLTGNHEDVMLKFLNAEDAATARRYGGRWVNYGGDRTIASYGVDDIAYDNAPETWRHVQTQLRGAMPADHVTFFEQLDLMLVLGDFVFVHAGLRPGALLDEQSAEDMLWIRDEFLNDDGPLEKKVVHGHTPESEPVLTERRVGVDTGAYATGVLSAARIWSHSVEFLQVTSE